MSIQVIQTQITQNMTASNTQYMNMLQTAMTTAQTTGTWIQTGVSGTGVPNIYHAPPSSGPPPPSHAPYYSGASRLDFNKYLNASDLLEEFIDDVQALGGVTKEEFLKLPVESFIKWLVIKAAEADDEPPPEADKGFLPPALFTPSPQPAAKFWRARCDYCGRFNTYNRDLHGFRFCNGDHYDKYEAKIKRVCSGG